MTELAGADLRIAALRRFAVAISVLNILGHSVLGFEQSWAQPLVALAVAYTLELVLELLTARAERRRPRFVGGPQALLDFLLPGHITALAVSMLLFSNAAIGPTVFATAVAVGSKALFRAPVNGRRRHYFNPSNVGIAATLLVFPWVGIAPPYQFTEGVVGALDWIIPGIIIVSGTFLNWRFTRKLPLIVAWLGTFAAQAVARSLVLGSPMVAGLTPMTGLAFLLFTFYMVSDPGTTPRSTGRQVAFGVSVALVYGLLQVVHVVFGLFFSLGIVCAVRGVGLHAMAARRAAREARKSESLAPVLEVARR